MQGMVTERLKLMHELWEKNLSDTTIEAVVRAIENTRVSQGHREAEQKAIELKAIVDSSKTEQELLQKLNQLK